MLSICPNKMRLSHVLWLLFLFSSTAFARGPGFHLTKVEKDSVYARLGMQEGDVLQSYNGKLIQSEKDLMALLELLKKSDSPTVKLVIDRNGQHKEFIYNFGRSKEGMREK